MALAFQMYADEHEDSMPAQTGNGVNRFADSNSPPNFLRALIPYVGNLEGGKSFGCPTAKRRDVNPAETPDLFNDSNYMGNAAVLGRARSSILSPASVVVVQEDFWRRNVAWLRPGLEGTRFSYWHDRVAAVGNLCLAFHTSRMAFRRIQRPRSRGAVRSSPRVVRADSCPQSSTNAVRRWSSFIACVTTRASVGVEAGWRRLPCSRRCHT